MRVCSALPHCRRDSAPTYAARLLKQLCVRLSGIDPRPFAQLHGDGYHITLRLPREQYIGFPVSWHCANRLKNVAPAGLCVDGLARLSPEQRRHPLRQRLSARSKCGLLGQLVSDVEHGVRTGRRLSQSESCDSRGASSPGPAASGRLRRCRR